VTRAVALLRGINVGKAKRIAMADLRAVITGLGYGDVRTLLNSGNAVFDVPAKLRGDHAARIRAAIATSLTVTCDVYVITAAELDRVVEENALTAHTGEPSRFLVSFFHADTALAPLRALAKEPWSPEAMHVGSRAVYQYCANGILESAVGKAVSKALGAKCTARNWSTVMKLHAMVHA
jgi:uncharacterized protein (DUF1697 family)